MSRPQSQTDAMAEWAALLSTRTAQAGGEERLFAAYGDREPNGVAESMISDMRVEPLIKTQWSQAGYWTMRDYGSYYTYEYCQVFDYYLWANEELESWEGIPCGCVATSGAQIMYFWKSPGSIGSFNNTCYLLKDPAHPETTTFPKQLQSIPGIIDWNSMFKSWSNSVIEDTACEAMGRLTYNTDALWHPQ